MLHLTRGVVLSNEREQPKGRNIEVSCKGVFAMIDHGD